MDFADGSGFYILIKAQGRVKTAALSVIQAPEAALFGCGFLDLRRFPFAGRLFSAAEQKAVLMVLPAKRG